MNLPQLRGTPVYCSWSGGKDSALALHEAVRRGAEPRLLVTMMTEGGQRSPSHGLRRALLERQARAMGLAITFGSATWSTYTEEFRSQVAVAVDLRLAVGVFGDIDTEGHRLAEAGVDLAGENGDYHTVIVDGPVLRRPLEVEFGEVVRRDGVWFTDVWVPDEPG